MKTIQTKDTYSLTPLTVVVPAPVGGSGIGDVLDQYKVSTNIRTAVVTGTYNTRDELIASVAESLPGMRFSYDYYVYEYMPGDSGTLTWVRNVKGGGSSGSTVPIGTVSTAERTGNTIKFDLHAEYAPITNGTFTVDLTGKKVGATVSVYLDATATDPTANLPATQFQTKDTFTGNTNQEYIFKVGANGFIGYVIRKI